MTSIKSLCIIDDDPIYTFGVKKIIEMGNFDVNAMFYQNGQEAYEGLASKIDNGDPLPDMILLDINMPIWNGWKFLDEFLKIEPATNIIIYIISSSIDPNDTKKAKEYSVIKNFIVKPISIEKVKELLEENT
ncbi:response regulator [Echinicola vietnamensis]|uniref:Response regulator containing CheY-like receiver domain and AraC-type DNA-binding domain n=1 Tax=Echinicola vietnamensis (strain DSM 17526 / LMG 23754 / KMM 6221) TaxID=926556 RepID=L0G413_ECHVK|nr:response regulator [Echinicola vietnamensis]AGA80023.1 response regulator containing CheY-like receiver domain and AraC-type DNA-binding domain [Echinicola vietnamensis DSM 17526]